MSLWRKRDLTGITAADLIPRRSNPKPGMRIDADAAMRNSAVWACLRLRADLMSSFPLDTYRDVDGRQIETPKPAVLVTPGGPRCRMKEWTYSTQVDLDRYGNAFGIISARDGHGLPAQIDLVCAGDVVVIVRQGQLVGYRIGHTTYDPPDVWHEKQYTIAGLHVGLSPIAAAAWNLGVYSSIQQFALDWFNNGTMPAATLKNTAKMVPPRQAQEIKDVFRASVERGDVFVHGADWEFSMLNSQAAASNWLAGQEASLMDICRFMGCPADVVDVVVSGQSITYANMTTRNLQLLILNIGPAVARREEAWSYGLMPQPRYAKLNTNALLRLDPATQSEMLGQQLRDRMRAPSEVRALYDLLPYTPAQLAEFDRLYGSPKPLMPGVKELNGATSITIPMPAIHNHLPERAVNVAGPNVFLQEREVHVAAPDVHIAPADIRLALEAPAAPVRPVMRDRTVLRDEKGNIVRIIDEELP